MKNQHFFLQATPLNQKVNPNVTTTKNEVANAASAPTAAPQQPGTWTLLLPLLLIGVFYFILIRPQQKKEKQRQSMLKQLKKSDKVLTRGGIYGVITKIDEKNQYASVKIAEKVNVDVAINSIDILVNNEKAALTKSKK